MPGFRFSETASFEVNWEAFLGEMDAVDADMAKILRDNKDKLAAIMHQGHRNAQARAEFNANVMEALDGVLTASSTDEEC